ncbi:MAG: hypothetical protein IJX19_05380, partial [Clostridia bacterium]|nr:hypothetical protein [Clostridia bacterium]
LERALLHGDRILCGDSFLSAVGGVFLKGRTYLMVCAFVFNSTPCDDRSLDSGHREDEQTEKTRKRAFTNGEGGAGKARGAGTLEIIRQLNFSKRRKDEELLKFLVFFLFLSR